MFFPKQLLSLAAFSALVTSASAQGTGTIDCSRFGIVEADDTCDIISVRENVSTYAACPFET
jgi:hypothetical protein